MDKFARVTMPVITTAAMLVLVMATVARAGTAVPEINPVDGMSALALIGGTVLVIRGWRKK